MRTVILLSVGLLLGGCIHVAALNPAVDVQPENITAETEVPATETVPEESEPTPTPTPDLEPTVLVEAAPLPEFNADDVELARRILKLKSHGIWFECGVKYKQDELEGAALDWAVAINDAHDAIPEYQLRNKKLVKHDIREALGIMQNESRLDRCAVGPYPRIYAYKKGILVRKPNTLSHSLPEIQKAIQHKGFKRRKADLGPGQIVVYLGDMSWDEIRAYLTLTPGITKVFEAMTYRGKMYNTRRPSYHWPGSKQHQWYYRKIMRGIMSAFPEVRHLRYK